MTRIGEWTTKELTETLSDVKQRMEAALGVPVRLNVRHDRRGDDGEVYKTQVEIEAYVEGPGQQREREEAEARAKAAADAEVEARAKEEAEAQAAARAAKKAVRGA